MGKNIIRMPNYFYPKITLEGRIPGQRSRGRLPKQWVENIKSSCQDIGITSTCETIRLIYYRGLWVSLVKRLLSPRIPIEHSFKSKVSPSKSKLGAWEQLPLLALKRLFKIRRVGIVSAFNHQGLVLKRPSSAGKGLSFINENQS